MLGLDQFPDGAELGFQVGDSFVALLLELPDHLLEMRVSKVDLLFDQPDAFLKVTTNITHYRHLLPPHPLYSERTSTAWGPQRFPKPSTLRQRRP